MRWYRLLVSQEKKIVMVILAGYLLIAGVVGVLRHEQFDSFWYDFGIFDETVWKLSRFQWPVIATKGNVLVWGDHFNPSVLTIVPLYWLTSWQGIIILAQAFGVVLGGYFLWLVMRQEIKNMVIRLALIFAYLGYVGMQFAMYTDVHNTVMAVLPLCVWIWVIKTKKWRWYWWVFLWFIGWQEDLAGIGAGMGIYLLKNKDTRKRGLLTLIISLVYGLLVIKRIIPAFNQGAYGYDMYWPTGIEWLSRWVWPAIKLKTIIVSVMSFGGLPLLSPWIWPSILSQYLIRFVFNNAGTRWDLGMHYNAIVTPLLLLGAIDGVRKFQGNKYFKRASYWMGLGIILLILLFHRLLLGPLQLALRSEFYQQTNRNSHYREFLDKIPRDKGLIMTMNNLAAHLTHDQVVLLKQDYKRIDPKVIAVYLLPGQNPNNYFPVSEAGVKLMVKELENDVNYSQVRIGEWGYVFVK